MFERIVVVTNREEVGRATQVDSIGEADARKGPRAGVEAGLADLGGRTFVGA